jgi:Fe-S cluster assembly protein SufD
MAHGGRGVSVGVEPHWLLARRDEAERTLVRTGIPDGHDEAWKYLDAKQFLVSAQPSLPDDVSRSWPPRYPCPRPGRSWSSPEGSSGGTCRGWPRRCLESRWIRFRRPGHGCPFGGAHLGELDPLDSAMFAANRERWSDGLFLKIPPTALPGPVQILDIGSGSSYLRHLVVAGPRSRAEILELRAAPDGILAVSRSVLEADLQEGASVSYREPPGGRRPAALLGGTGRAPGARGGIHLPAIPGFGRAFADGDGGGTRRTRRAGRPLRPDRRIGWRVADVLTVVRHASPRAVSHQLFQALAGGKSTASFLGIVQVERDAQKTSARQSNRNLLLSREASINSRPQLEIWADDVKCSHGSTTGRLDDKALFFLRSRGFSEAGARALLVRAFAGELVEKLPEGSFRSLVETLLEETL